MRKKFIILLCSILIYSISVSAQKTTNLVNNSNATQVSVWVDSVYNSMSLDEKIGQLFMPVVETNKSWKNRIEEYIKEKKVSGLLFGKGTMATQAELTNFAQSISKTPLLIALDGEWGLSMRLRDAPIFPKNRMLGAIQDDSLIYLYGKEIARQCKEMGIHVNFAPSVDVNTNPSNPIIGARSFGNDASNVALKGIAFARGLEDGGVMSVAKHFPGHGDTSEDSHKTLPTIPHDSARLDEVELYPFRRYVDAGLSGMMIGHLNVPELKTKGLPASLTPSIGEKLLHEEMGFSGLTFTDGMAMKGVSNQQNMSVKALLAGNDIILGVPNLDREINSVKKAIENGSISEQILEEKVKRILTYKYILDAQNFKPIDINSLKKNVTSTYTSWLQQKLYESSLTLIKNEENLIPVKGLDKNKIAVVSIGASSNNVFQKTLKKYADVSSFHVSSTLELPEIEKELMEFDIIIYGIHNINSDDVDSLHRLTNNKNSIIVFFTDPSEINQFNNTVGQANSVLLAYDNTDKAQKSAAQGIFGGIGITGKLPLDAGKYLVGTGEKTEKIRLAYSMPEEVGISSEKFDGVEKIALESIRQKANPGCYVMVVKDGVVIYDRAFGNFEYGNSPKVTSETVYDLASVTKTTATLPAIMKLYDDNSLRLQDPISKFVSETKDSNKSSITIRELLFHESGIISFIPYYKFAMDLNSTSEPLFGKKSSIFNAYYAGAWGRTDYEFIPDLISNEESSTFYMPVADKLYASDKMHDKLLKEVIDTDLRRRGRYEYSCLNFMLLKEAVESISKTDLNTFVQKNFYDKLGMTTTTFQPLKHMSIDNIPPTENDPFFRKQQIRGYVHDEGAALFGGISGNAGLFSNANDLAKLFQMWLNDGEYGGEQILSKKTVQLFTTQKSSKSRRGLGFDKPDLQNSNYSPCSPQTPISVYGHTGFTGTSFWVDPTNNMIYIFLSNRVFPSRSPNKQSSLNIRERIQEELYNAIKKN